MTLPVIASKNILEYGLNPKLPEVFDATMLSDFAACPSLFYHRHVLGLQRKGAPSVIQFAWGGSWHKLHELLHMGLYEQGLDMRQAMEMAVAEVADKWDHSIDWALDRNGRNMQRMILLFANYVERFKEDERWITPLRSEQYFDIYCPEGSPDCPLGGGCGLRWCGRMDRLVKVRQRVLVWDYKTTSAMGETYFERYEHSFQMPGYYWAAMHMVPQGVDGVLLDVVYTLKAKEDFFRRTFRYIPDRIIEWRENVKKYIEQIHIMWEKYSHEPEAWHKQYGNCSSYSGCTFSHLHFTAPIGDTRLRMMASDYVESRWDPSEVD